MNFMQQFVILFKPLTQYQGIFWSIKTTIIFSFFLSFFLFFFFHYFQPNFGTRVGYEILQIPLEIADQTQKEYSMSEKN